MKRPGDMKRRRQAAYCKGWNDAMDALDLRIEVLRRDGHLSDKACRSLETIIETPPPELAEIEPEGGHGASRTG